MSDETLSRLSQYYNEWIITPTHLGFWMWLMHKKYGTTSFPVFKYACSNDEIDILLSRYALIH